MSWTEQIYTPTGFTKKNILNGKRAVDLGCGVRKLPGATGIDSLKLPAVDIVHNLDTFPWPLKDKEFDLVFANHFLEHSTDFIRALGEIHRILKPGGRFVLQVPYFRAVDAFSDVTHKHFFTSHSLDYVIEGTRVFNEYAYAPYRFRKVGFWYAWPHPSKNPLANLFKRFIHRHPDFYDQYLSLVLPLECVTWELEAL